MTSTVSPNQLPKRTKAQEFAHSLRNIVDVMEGSLRVMEEARGDEVLLKAARDAMSMQLKQLKLVASRTPGSIGRAAPSPPRA